MGRAWAMTVTGSLLGCSPWPKEHRKVELRWVPATYVVDRKNGAGQGHNYQGII